MRGEFKKWISVPTRFRDLDPMNHVNSTIYFVYFEMARIEYFKDIGVAQMRHTGKSGIPGELRQAFQDFETIGPSIGP